MGRQNIHFNLLACPDYMIGTSRSPFSAHVLRHLKSHSDDRTTGQFNVLPGEYLNDRGVVVGHDPIRDAEFE